MTGARLTLAGITFNIIFFLESKFPYLNTEKLSRKEKIQTIGRLEEERELIQMEFVSLVSTTCESFKKRKVKSSKVTSILRNLNIKLKYTDITEAFISASDYMSFFNYEILEDLINKFGDDTDKKRLAAYLLHFDKYCKRRLSEVPIDALKSDGKITTQLHVRSDKHSCLKDIKSLQIMLSKILSCRHLRLLGFGCSCTELDFDYLKRNLHLTSDEYSKLEHLGVTKLFTDEQVFYDQSSKSIDLKSSEVE